MALIKDPVCGMEIETEDAVEQVEHEGATYFFCSAHCRKTFEEAPEDYVSSD